jgi:hypothetical protein
MPYALLDSFLAWSYQAPLTVAIRESRWGFASIEVVHLFSLAGLGGGVLVASLDRAGWLGTPAAQGQGSLARALRPWLLAQWLVIVVSGYLLFSTNSIGYSENAAFRSKILLLVLASAWTAAWLGDWGGALSGRAWQRPAALATIIGWTAVALAGRAIGVL